MNEEQRRAVDTFREVLESSGLHAALEFLNGRTAHRFTGLYRFDAPTLRNVRLYDRENPALEVGEDSPMRETYCSLVGETGAAFATGDAAHDARLRDHPARDSVAAYCGVPLRDGAGAPFGTFCHFDLRPRPVPRDEVPVLEAVAPLVARVLLGE